MHLNNIDIVFSKIALLLTFLLFSIWGAGQNYTYTGTGLWSDDTKWSNSPDADFLSGNLSFGTSTNIYIDGRVNLGTSSSPVDLDIEGNVSLNLNSGDPLFIWGNLNVNSGTINNLNTDGVLIVRGNFNISSGATFNISGNSNNFIGVSGDFTNSGSSTYNSNSSNVYVLGGADSPLDCTDPSNYSGTSQNPCFSGNIDALINNEPPSTRKLLLGNAELTLNYTINDLSCYKSGDGEVVLQGQGGSFAYQYSMDSVDWYPSTHTSNDYTFSNLPAGDTTVWVRDDDVPEASVSDRINITIEQPDSLELSIDAQTWSCDNSTNGCNAYITASITGGTPPYDVVLDDGTTSDTQSTNNNYTFNGLCAGTYTIDVTDAEGCNIAELGNVTITEDVTPPSCTEFPGDSTFTLDQFNELDSTYAYLSRLGIDQEQSNPADEDTIIYTFDGNNFNDLFLNFTITQDGNDEWETSDSVAFWLDYNTDVRLYADSSGHVAPSDSVALPEIASGKSPINILIIYTTGGDKSYSFDEVTLSGNSMSASIPTSISGEPTGCTDDFVTPDITYSDDFIQWVCNESGNKEFWFERTFTISDGCDNEETYTQKIGVGEYPWIEEPKDTILDNCNVTNIQLPVPGYSDACDTDASLAYVVKAQGETSNVAAGSVNSGDTHIEVTFTQPDVNDTIYEVTWIATDIAGLMTNEVQEVKVLRPMTIALNPIKEDFCSGELISFEIVVDGGTGAYQDPVITPSGGTLTKDSDDTFTYETDQLDLAGTTDLTINITSEDNVIESVNVEGGSCSTGDLVFYHGTGVEDSYTIHENISTNQVERP